MTRTTPGSRVRAAIVSASSPASAGVVFIFQLAAMMTGRIVRIMPERGAAGVRRPRRRAWPAPAAADALVGMEGEPLDALERPLDGRAVEPEPLGQLGERGLGRLPPCLGDEPDDVWLLGEAAIAVELVDRRDLPARRADGSLEVRRLGVEDPVQVAAQRPRDLARLELEERARRPRSGAGTARPCRRSSRSRRHGRAGAATTPGGPTSPRRSARSRRLVGVDDELEVGPPAREAERAAGEEQAAQVGQPAVLGRRSPSRTAASAARRRGRGATTANADPAEPDRQPGHRSLADWATRPRARPPPPADRRPATGRSPPARPAGR